MAKIMRKHYGRDPKTGCLALFIYKPGVPPSAETRYFIWHKTPHRLTFASVGAGSVEDRQAYLDSGGPRDAACTSDWKPRPRPN